VNYEDFAASKMEIELYRSIAAKRAEILETLAAGTPESMEKYRFWTGYIAALKDFNEIIVATRKKLNKE
jgi:hypothetical protein